MNPMCCFVFRIMDLGDDIKIRVAGGLEMSELINAEFERGVYPPKSGPNPVMYKVCVPC